MDLLTATFRTGNLVRTRTVSATVRTAILDVPIPPPRLLADWNREITRQLGLDAGDIEPLPLARTRLRWPELRRCVEAVDQWLTTLGLPAVLDSAEVALMASRGTPYHHDGATYASKAFCNLFLSDDSGTDLHFPAANERIALVRGTAVIFDPCQPHAIIKRGGAGFDPADFALEHMRPQVFLTWEMPIEHESIARALGITFDLAPMTSLQLRGEQVWRNDSPVTLCSKTGNWMSQT
jgi:hypothetical protein